jgi:hypothetical protein
LDFADELLVIVRHTVGDDGFAVLPVDEFEVAAQMVDVGRLGKTASSARAKSQRPSTQQTKMSAKPQILTMMVFSCRNRANRLAD